ncbi:hypothetical protein D3C78_1005460 [compost metagenome]
MAAGRIAAPLPRARSIDWRFTLNHTNCLRGIIQPRLYCNLPSRRDKSQRMDICGSPFRECFDTRACPPRITFIKRCNPSFAQLVRRQGKSKNRDRFQSSRALFGRALPKKLETIIFTGLHKNRSEQLGLWRRLRIPAASGADSALFVT